MCLRRLDKMYYFCFENTQFNPCECFVIEDFSKPSSYSATSEETTGWLD